MLVVLGAMIGSHSTQAQETIWTGAGGSDFWSNGGNWSAGVPVTGGTATFGVNGGGDSTLDFTLSLASFRFAPFILPEHNFHLASGASLTLTGFGIDNISRIPGFGQPQFPPGVIRQQLFMESGSTLTFRNSATVGGSDPIFSLPVDLVSLGGRIIFENQSSASGLPANTFTGLRIYGGGELIFRDTASMGSTAVFAIHPGDVAGALGGTAIFEGNSVASSGSNSNLSGTGKGGRVIFRGAAKATGSISLNNNGASTLDVDNEAVTQILDGATFDAFSQNFAGNGTGKQGGRLEFRQSAVFGGTGGFIINRGSSLDGGEGGRTLFFDNARILGTNAIISNQTETEGAQPGSSGGFTEFRGNSRAGAATIYNSGSTSAMPGTTAARTSFLENSSAENANIFAGGGAYETGAFGSSVEFSGTSTAANASLTAQGGNEGGLGGRIIFTESANGSAAAVAAELGGVFDMSGLATSSTTLGSIAGAGTFFLGGKSLTVGGNGQSTIVSGSIADGGQAGGTGATLTKVGAGTLTLGGTNTYGGSTTVNAGGLVVNGSLGGPSVSVATGALLGGSGAITAPVTIAAGGHLAPGAIGTFGTLSVGPLTLNAGTQLDFQLRDGAHDQVAVSGPFTLDGTLNVSAPSGLTLGVYRLFDYTGAFTDNGLTLGTLPPGTTPAEFTIVTSTPGQVDLILGGDTDLLFWDGPQTAPNNVVNGGNGNWNNATTNWTNSGGSVQRGWNGHTAVFSGTAGTVTLAENVAVNGLQFVTANYVINASGGNSVTLAGMAPVRVDGTQATISAPFSGTGTLVKTGNGSLVLTGISNYTGGTDIVDGELIVTSASGLGLGTGPVTVRESRTSYLIFSGTGSAGSVIITNEGSTSTFAGVVEFRDSATAANAALTNQGNAAEGASGAATIFYQTSHAGPATLHNFGAGFAGGSGGLTYFQGTSSADSANISNDAGLGNGLNGGFTNFYESATAANASIVNHGGSVAGAIGGFTQFLHTSTAGSSTLTVEGGTNGGFGGTIRFFGNSTGGVARIIFLPGGAANGLLDISGVTSTMLAVGSIEGNGLINLGDRRLEVGGINTSTEFSGSISGFGGAIRKIGTGTLALAGVSTYTGGTVIFDGILEVKNPAGSGLGTGPVTVLSSPTSELRFSDQGSAGTASITNVGSAISASSGITTFRSLATAANANIVNQASVANGAAGGNAQFYGTASAGSAKFDNLGSNFLGGPLGIGGGDIFFFENSTAASATITNRGGLVNGGEGGQANFFNATTGANAIITNHAAVGAGAYAGASVFRGNSTAGSATISNMGSNLNGAVGGVAEFFDTATLGSATVTNAGGVANPSSGGVLHFLGSSSAGTGKIFNRRAPVANASGGSTQFLDSSHAGSATFTNEGAQIVLGYGTTDFYGTSNAETAKFFNGASLAGGYFGGRTHFYDASSAGNGVYDNEGSKAARTLAGQTTEAGETNFRGTTSAAGATITNHGKTVALGATGGITQFFVTSTAGTATIINEGSLFASNPDPAGGWTKFLDQSSAEQAVITNQAPLSSTGGPGLTQFQSEGGQLVTADRATITNNGALFAFQVGGQTTFNGTATAGTGVFTNQGGQVANAFGGATYFLGTSTAATASFSNQAGKATGSDGGFLGFFDDTRAGQSSITNSGGTVTNTVGGETFFRDRSNAAAATLHGLAGAPGALGGRFTFLDLSDGGTARLVLDGSSAFEAAELQLNTTEAGIGIGSVEGSGTITLNGKTLAVGTNNLSTTFSGLIQDGLTPAGRLTKVGTGTLVLSGTNTYTGQTTVLDGILRITGSIAGGVDVQGGVLGGNGTIAGPITVGAGGIVSPGASIGTFDATGGLAFESGSVYGLEIDSTTDTADSFSAVNVTIATGVNLLGQEIGLGGLPIGLHLSIINNTSASPTVGTFAGLDEGAQFAVGINVLQISYSGGDGNDVVLTNLIPEPGAALSAMAGLVVLGVTRCRRTHRHAN